MQIDVRLFAILRERAGVDRVELELPEGATVQDARAELAKRYPAIDPLLARTATALNREYVKVETTLTHGDELALIPPVSGG